MSRSGGARRWIWGWSAIQRLHCERSSPKLEQNQHEAHLKESLEEYRKARKGLDEHGHQKFWQTRRFTLNMLRACWIRLASEDAIFTCDVGTPTIWAARYLTMNGKRRLLGSFTHGSMANALPQAIGAQVSSSGAPGDLDVG